MRGTFWPCMKVIGGMILVSVFQNPRRQYASSGAGAVTSRCVPCPWWHLSSLTLARTVEVTHLLSSAQQIKAIPWEQAVPSPCPCFALDFCSSVSRRALSAGGLGQSMFIVCNPIFRVLLFYLLQIILHSSQLALSFTFCSMLGNFWLLIFQRHPVKLSNAGKRPQTA